MSALTPPAAPGPGARGQLLQARGFLVVTGAPQSRRRVALACGGQVRLPQLLVGVAEVGRGYALAVPVAGLPEDRQRILAAADGLLEPPQLLVGQAEVGQGQALAVPAGPSTI